MRNKHWFGYLKSMGLFNHLSGEGFVTVNTHGNFVIQQLTPSLSPFHLFFLLRYLNPKLRFWNGFFWSGLITYIIDVFNQPSIKSSYLISVDVIPCTLYTIIIFYLSGNHKSFVFKNSPLCQNMITRHHILVSIDLHLSIYMIVSSFLDSGVFGG